jgi:outer membrane receptor protein involved in Fe transport
MIRVPLLTVAVAALLLLPVGAPLAAQERPSAARPDSLHADSARAQRLQRVVVSGARLAPATDPRLPVRHEPVDLTAVPHGSAGAAELLQRLPGVSVSNDQGSRDQPTLELRGFSLSPVVGVAQGVSVFLDGVRVNEPDAQEVNFDLLPMEAVESAELVRGPSALFGKNTLGGSINLRTMRGGDVPRVAAGVDAGSFGERDLHLAAGGLWRGLDGFVSLQGATDAGYQTQSGGTTRRLFATVGRRGGDDDVAVSLLVARNRIYEAGSLPESWLAVARRANYTGGDVFRPALFQLAVRAVHALGDARLRATAFVRHDAIEQLNANASGPDTRAFVDNGSLGATAELSLPAHLFGRPLDVTFGAEVARTPVHYRVFAEPNAYAAGPPAGCDAVSPGAALCEDAHADGDDAGLFAQVILHAARQVSVLLSARGDYARIPFRDQRDSANDGTSTFVRLSPKLGITVAPLAALRLYASVGSAFRAPAPLELACASADASCPLPFSLGADPPLRPVVAWSSEIGGEWTSPAGSTAALSLFDTEVRDDIVFVSAGRAAGYFQNVPRTRRRGVELSFSALLPGQPVRLFGSYTLLDATYRSEIALASALDGNVAAPGARFALSPRHRVTLGLDVAHGIGGMELGGTLAMRAVSSAFMRGDEGNRAAPLAGYVVSDLRLRARRNRVEVTAAAANLFDRRYAVYGVYAENSRGPYGGPPPDVPAVERFYTPAYPRTITLGMSVER